jgi:transketolase
MIVQQKDLRDAFFDEIVEAGRRDSQLVVITNDMDVFSLRQFRKEYPERFINVGVAEQNMINVAAGLASCGKKVLVFGISSFVTFRCFEQLKFNVCSMNLPVILAGVGSGLSFSYDGPTHHGTQDIAVLRSLPELAIYNPGDIVSAVACAREALRARSPIFVRIDKGSFPALHDPGHPLDEGFGILRRLSDVNIVTTGLMTPRVMAVAEALAERGVSVGVVDVFRLKPLSDRLISEVLRRSRGIVTVEENALTGGLGSIISECITDDGLGVKLLRLAAADEQVLRYGERDWLLEGYGLHADGLVTRIANYIDGC